LLAISYWKSYILSSVFLGSPVFYLIFKWPALNNSSRINSNEALQLEAKHMSKDFQEISNNSWPRTIVQSFFFCSLPTIAFVIRTFSVYPVIFLSQV